MADKLRKFWQFLPYVLIVLLLLLVAILWQKSRTPTIVREPVVKPLPEVEPMRYDFYEVLPKQALMPLTEQEGIAPTPVPEYKPDVVLKRNAGELESGAGDSMTSDMTSDKATKNDGNNTDNAKIDNTIAINANADSANPDSTHPDANNFIIKSSVHYILQINSFETADDAEARRAEVLTAGVDAMVVQKNTPTGVLYQVVSKPIQSSAEVMRAQQMLMRQGIDALVIEQHDK